MPYILLLALVAGLAGKASPTQPILFTNLTVESGLSSNITSSIVEDKYGFMWIGTQEGLCRFDGYRMLHFQSGTTVSTIPSNSISTLLYDNDRIWVGTWGGLCAIDIYTFAVTRVNTGQSSVIRALHRDPSGAIWVGTSNGLLVLNKSTGELKSYSTANSALTHNTIRSFYQTSNGDLWVGTYDGLNRFRNGEFEGFNLKGNYKPLIENNLILQIKPYSRTNDTMLWVGTETGLALFDTRSGEYRLFNSSNTSLSNEVIKCIHQQSDTTLWLGTDFGLNIISTHSHEVTTHYHDPLVANTIASNVVWEILEDSQRRVWLITSNGVSIVDNGQQFFTLHEEFFARGTPRIGNQVKDILLCSNGELWLASIHGVTRKNTRTGKRATFSTSSPPSHRILLDNVYTLMEDRRGRVWIGTAGGINIWDGAKGVMHSVTANRRNGLLSNYISHLVSLPDGSYWVSAWEGGLFRVKWDTDNPIDMQFTLVDRDGGGRMSVSGKSVYYGSGSNFWSIDTRSLQRRLVERVTSSLGGRQISAQWASSDGTVWIGADNLLIGYQPLADSLIRMAINMGKPQKIINIQDDDQGNIWATTQNTIIWLNRITLDHLTIPLPQNSPLKGFYNHCNALSDGGNILFGGDNGYIEINPRAFDAPRGKPNIHISSISVNNQQVLPSDSALIKKDIAFSSSINLRYNQNSISLDFTTLDFLYAGGSQFAYRLLPAEREWQYTTGRKNFAVLANLTPGEYTFEVKGTDRLGAWSDYKSLQISIAPPVWRTPLFYVIYALIIVALIYITFWVFSYRQRLRNELRILKLEKQHSEALYQLKIQFFTNISHEFRTPLSLILPPLNELINTHKREGKYDRMLNLANRNAQRLYKLVNQLIDFRKLEASKLELIPTCIEIVAFCRGVFTSFDDMAARHEIEYTFGSDADCIYADADVEKLETIIFNLLSNAFKYTPFGGGIHMHITKSIARYEREHLEITIRDTGVGISLADQSHIFEQFYQTFESKSLNTGSGIGLTLAQEYAKLHNGLITVWSEPGQGSIFTVSIPIVRSSDCMEMLAATNEKPLPNAAANAVDQSPLPPTAKRLLLVDDNDDILIFIELNLKGQYHIHSARNGTDALELVERVKPHLVISDVMMPIMDGLELCQRIKGSRSTMHIPVILLTAKNQDKQRTEGMNMGADMYVTKPFDIEYLRSCIASIFRRDDLMSEYIRTQLLINPTCTPDSPTGGKNGDELFLKRVMTIIETQIDNPELTVEIIASEVGMSATHLYRKLKELTGHSTKEIIVNYRMQRAANMLRNKEGNISQVMYSIGFSSLSSFSKSFKGKFGVSPSEYR